MNNIERRNKQLHSIMKRMIEHGEKQVRLETRSLKQAVDTLIDFHYYLSRCGIEHKYELESHQFHVCIYVGKISCFSLEASSILIRCDTQTEKGRA